MRTTFRLFILLALLLAGFGLAPAGRVQAATAYPRCAPNSEQLTGVSDGGALWFICVPKGTWTGILVVYGHGYESPFDPANRKVQAAPTFANLTNPVDGAYLPDLIEGAGGAFGATTYRRTGLVAADGVEDAAAVALAAKAWYAATAAQIAPLQLPPLQIYMAGVSEGGLVTTLAVERHPGLFAGGLATCGPIGSFRMQTDYFGDFRTLYDYFFPDVLPGNTTNIPTALMTKWTSQFEPRALAALAQSPLNAGFLMNTSHAAFVPDLPQTVGLTTSGVLWYNVYAMENAKDILGGNPYDNQDKVYAGSGDDAALNANIHRYKASQTALDNLLAYETTGQLTRPLVSMHTTLDPVVPFQHEVLYGAKALSSGKFSLVPVERYGHCNFTSAEVMGAFQLLLQLSNP
jgi:pimeloyl-ACP methyl ester carboxylesterase